MSVSEPTIIDEDDIDEIELPPAPSSKHMYVDNDKLADAMLEWRDKIDAAKAAGLPIPPMSNYIGQSVMDIATNIAKAPNYSGYSWKEDMIGDAIEACCMYLHNYNPYASTRKGKPNPFGYISLSIERVFNQRIEFENRQLYYKNKSLVLMGVENFEGDDLAELGDGINAVVADMINRSYLYEDQQKVKADKERDKLKATRANNHLGLFDNFGDEE